MKKIILTVLCVLLTLSSLTGCTPDQPTTQIVSSTVSSTTTTAPTEASTTEPPLENEYKYTSKTGYYLWPCLADNWVERKVLITTTDDGTFYCMTSDKAQATDFVDAQRALLAQLREMGLETGTLKYYATDYEDSFSASRDGEAYIALSALETQQQVLVTLQALWGDYTDYGYVWAMSYAIAQALGYETQTVPAIETSAMDRFFAGNPDAIHLLYPSFTTKFASQETVDCCHALASHIFSDVNWRKAVATPIEAQLDTWYALVESYAKEIEISFTRQSIGYAYYSQRVPLRIMTSYAEMFVEQDYQDFDTSTYGDYFAHYTSIYETANAIDQEISDTVAFFGMEAEAGIVSINWISSDLAIGRYCWQSRAGYFDTTQTIYTQTIQPILHEYHHHIEHLKNPDQKKCWQSQAFCEIGTSKSRYGVTMFDTTFLETAEGIFLFYACTGRFYQGGREDFYEVMDILCYITEYYDLEYQTGAESLNSITRYLIELYGEKTAMELLLFPDTVETVTGKSWEQLRSEWEQHIRAKYAHVDLPQRAQ